MRRLTCLVLASAFVWMSDAQAQFGRSSDWMTSGYDAQRSSWARTDPKISMASMQKPGFAFLWKLKLNAAARQLNSVTAPALLERLIGYRGFRALAFVSTSSDKIYSIDYDLARIDWQLQLPSGPPQAGSLTCPGGLTSAVTRPTFASFPPVAAGGGGLGGRGGPARSGVGEPDQGATTLRQAPAVRPAPPAAARPARNRPGSTPPAFGAPSTVFVLSSSGMLHNLNTQNGADATPPTKFLPPNANASGLIMLEDFAYASTDGNCAGVSDGIWALDFASKQVVNWKSPAGVVGSAGPVFGPDGDVYVTTRNGQLVRLEAEKLKEKGSYAAGQPFTSSPVVFEFKGKTLIAATAKDGRIHMVDAANLSAAVDKSPADSNATDFLPGALSSWQDSAGVRWVLAPTARAIVAYKIVERNGKAAFEPGWVSPNLASPIAPMIINGVVFALASGEFRSADSKITAAQRAQRSTPAVLYALDGATGKPIWNSGKTITSFVHSAALSGQSGQVYVGTYDGTLYAFGFPMEH